MERRDFAAMMKCLKKFKILSSQRELALFMDITSATVSDMKKRGYVTEKWLKNLALAIAQREGKDPEALFSLFLDNIPEYDAERERQHREEAGVSGRDFLLPSRESCEDILPLESEEFDYYSDVIALNKRILKHPKDIAIIKYPKTNLSPDINPGDTLVIKKTSEFEGPGYYLLEEYKNIKAFHISKKIGAHDALNVRTTYADTVTVEKEYLQNMKLLAKVIYLFRDTTLSEG